MPWALVISTLVENAPAIINSAEKFIRWAEAAITDTAAAVNKPASEVTAEDILGRLDRIQSLSDQIQAPG